MSGRSTKETTLKVRSQWRNHGTGHLNPRTCTNRLIDDIDERDIALKTGRHNRDALRESWRRDTERLATRDTELAEARALLNTAEQQIRLSAELERDLGEDEEEMGEAVEFADEICSWLMAHPGGQ